ncbi:DUF371 domain-containing protein [Candidatus Woesearchaeota archaeon]|nr:DUF371 domain-containing protein [Candidatus Woesearchaeota archaeon]
MEYSFSCYGHKNIIAKHKTTLEFTKEKNLSLKGDCIVAVNSDFSLQGLKHFIDGLVNNLKNKKIKITLEAITKNKEACIKDTINAEINPNFNDSKEIVIRKTGFVSQRTLAVNSDKSAFELKKELIEFLKNKSNKVAVTIEGK